MNTDRWMASLHANRAALALTALLVVGAGAPAYAAGQGVACGTVVLQNLTLKSDVGPCAGDGLVVGASNVSIDLNGYRVFGSKRLNVGVRLESVNNVTVKGGTVEGFGTGVLVVGGAANTVTHMTVQNNRFGIQIEDAPSSAHIVEKTLVARNRLIGILFENVSGATIRKNGVNGNTGYGIVLDRGSSYNVIENNEVNDAGDSGIELRAEEFIFERTNLAAPVLDVVSPDRPAYVEGVDYHAMSGPNQAALGDVTGRLVAVGVALDPRATAIENPTPADTSASGCRSSDYVNAGLQPGDIALVQRGTCTLDDKLGAALSARAGGLVMFNEGQVGRTTFDFGTVGQLSVTGVLPVISTTYAVGFELYQLARSSGTTVRMSASMSLNMLPDSPATHDNVVTKNAATSAVDESTLCGSNRWSKNDFGLVNRPCVAGDYTGGDGGGSGTGATSHNY